MIKNKPVEGWKEEKCKRCGKVYPVQGVNVCPCHPMFNEKCDNKGGFIEFKDEENQMKSKGTGIINIYETWSKDKNGVGTLIERYYINPNGDKTYLPVLPHQEVQFIKYTEEKPNGQ